MNVMPYVWCSGILCKRGPHLRRHWRTCSFSGVALRPVRVLHESVVRVFKL
jgi:hypothetical protein